MNRVFLTGNLGARLEGGEIEGMMIDESAEMQLKQLLTKALDEAFEQGLESGKRTGFESGRRAGIEEAIVLCAAKKNAYREQADRCSHWAIKDLEADILELLEAK